MLKYAKNKDNFKKLNDYYDFFVRFYERYFKGKFSSFFDPMIIMQANEIVRTKLFMDKYYANISLEELMQRHNSVFDELTLNVPSIKRK